MLQVDYLTFNAFQENTYFVYNEKGNCLIFDPGMNNSGEEEAFVNFIESKELNPVRLINTHCHLDHIFGNNFVAEKYGLSLEIHEGELPVLQAAPQIGQMYGVPTPENRAELKFLKAGEKILLDEDSLEILFTPGHSPASISFYDDQSKNLIGGDVLFAGSIGRTDLPGGDYDTLIKSIKEQFMVLADEVIVYSGHGPATTIGAERLSNPFLQ